jgi:hypothetical protein
MLCVVVGWVFFRATDLQAAISLLQSMAGFHGFAVPQGVLVRAGAVGEFIQLIGFQSMHGGGQEFLLTWLWNLTLLSVVLVMPNVQDMFNWAKCSLRTQSFDTSDSVWPMINWTYKLQWRANIRSAIAVSLCLALGLLTLFQVSEFLYFQF